MLHVRRVLGPSKQAAQLEGSKSFLKVTKPSTSVFFKAHRSLQDA